MEDNKPFTVIDTETMKVTDLKNGTSDVVLKKEGVEINVANSELLKMIRAQKNKVPVGGYRHHN